MATEKTKPAVKLLLGSQAISFPLPVTITKLDGTEAVVTFTCRSQRKTEWAQAKDSYQATQLQNKTARTDHVAIAAKETAKAMADALAAEACGELPVTAAEPPVETPANQPFDFAAFFAQHGAQRLVQLGIEADVGLALKAAIGWDLSDEFNDVNLQRMEDEFGGSIIQFVDAYDLAIFQGRLGNLPK